MVEVESLSSSASANASFTGSGGYYPGLVREASQAASPAPVDLAVSSAKFTAAGKNKEPAVLPLVHLRTTITIISTPRRVQHTQSVPERTLALGHW